MRFSFIVLLMLLLSLASMPVFAESTLENKTESLVQLTKPKKYSYKKEEFIISMSKDGIVSVSKDGITGTVRVNENNGLFIISVPDGILDWNYGDAQTALNRACDRILDKLVAQSKEALKKRRSELETLFNSL